MAHFVTHIQPSISELQHHSVPHHHHEHQAPQQYHHPAPPTKRAPHSVAHLHIDLHPTAAPAKESDGNTSFLRAARAGHLDKVLEQLRNNVDINTSNANGLNALHLASKDGHVHVVTELLKRGANVDSATKKGNTALHIASLAGQEEVVRLLVEHGACVNVQSQNGFTPLYMAAQENHDNVVKYLLSNGANQSLATEDGFTPLAVAMQQGHDKVVAVLLENDTRGKVRLPALHIAAKKDDCKAAALLLQNEHNPDVTSKSGFTPLHIASHYGNEGIANLLLGKGADVNYSAKHNITPLHVAAKWGKSNMVSLLLEKGANIESKTRDGLTPLHCAARSGHEQVVDMLLERGAPISCKTKNGLAPLHMASQGDHVDAARILLYHRAPVDEVTVDYLTALHVAAHCGHARVAKLLLDRKADPNARALNGFTPLHIACKKNRIKVVELLLKHGASIEATTESGLTPLHVASFMGCMNIVIYLLQNEANPDVPTVRGETPLHLAARANQTDIIRILLRNGAQVDARAREQQTPLHIASRLGNVDIVMLLLQHGAAVDCTTKDLYSALHIAAKEGQDEVASVLLENGASPTATTKKGFTPLHLAAKYGNIKVARLLLQKDSPVDTQGKNGVTPLHVASHYDHQNVALLLLDKGASPHATAKNGHTPLHIAAKKNQMDIATTLLEYGAKANAESKAGFTPLHLSAQEGHLDMSSLLIDHQADTNHKAKNGLAPLHLCAQEDRVNVASTLIKNGAEVDSTTKAGYTPLHVACHFGQINMVRLLLEEGSKVTSSTAVGYTPLHQAAQQGHCGIVNVLLQNGAPPNATTNQGQTAMSIAQKLGYISVVETLKGVTEPTTITPSGEEKYKVVSPETMQETFMSDSEDEGGEDTLLSEQPYRYLTVDEMKSLGDDSLPIDVRQDERMDSNRECMSVPPTAAVDESISPAHLKEAYSQFTTPDNVLISKHPLHVGKLQWRNFLVSFLVDARGGAMRGCRHSGVRVIVPPRRASMPMRVTCRYLKRDKLSHPPPLMEGEALASRILELGPVGAKFLGPVMIEVPHFGSLRGKEREIVILRSDNGETWREHTVDCSEEAVQDVLSHSFDKDDMAQLDESARTTRILTTDFPHYFAVVTRVRQEVHAIGPEGGMVSSSVVPQVQAVFPQGALTKKIKVGLQAQPIPAELAAKLLGNRVAVSPIVTVEPRRRKFHKPITLTIPKPQAANKGMINNYSGDAPTLRLLCSITGGTTRAQWEDVTGSTPFTFVNDCVSFTTTVSARFWLMDCRNVGDATKMATELYREAIHVPFMAKFVVFAKRVDPLEARLRIFCMTDDKEDKTLEHQEHFTEVAKSRDVEVLEGKTQYVEFAGNLVPVTKSGEQLQLSFRAFRENRLPFTVRVKDPHADCVGRTLFMREARLPKGEPPQQPICVLNIVLPEEIIPEASLPEHELHKYSFIQDSSGLESYQRVDLRLSDISNLLGDDWVRLAEVLEVAPSDINRLKTEHPQSVAQQGLAMLRLWLSQGNKAQASTLESALSQIGRDDIVQQCVFNTDQSSRLLKDDSRDASLRRSIPYSDKDIMKDSESVEDLSRTSYKKTGHFQEKDDKEEKKYEAEEKEVEEVKKSVSERRQEIEKRLSMDRQLEKQAEAIQEKLKADEEDFSEKEIAEEKRVSSPEEEPSELSFQQKRLSFEQGKRVIEMKPDKTTMKEVKDRAKDERFLAEERKAAERQQKEEEKLVDDTSIPFEEKRRSFEQKEEDKESTKKEELRRDSALFEGVSQGLVRLDAAFTATPQVQDLLSPKVSKTPPPSPAEFKDLTGTVAWTDDSPPAVVSAKIDQSQDWAEKGKPDSSLDPSKKEASQPEPSELGPTGDDTSLLLPTPSPRPLSDTPSDQQSSSDDIQDYSERKKFWEQMSTSSQESQRSQEGAAPPVPKPRLSIVSSVPLLKTEGESDTETTATTLSDSTVRIKNLQQDAVSKQSFTGSSDASDKDEVSETEAVEKPRALSSVSTTAETAVHDTTHEQGQKTGLPAAESSDSEGEYIAKHGQENLAYENTGFVPDEDTDTTEEKSLVKEESTDSFTLSSSKLSGKAQPVAATRKASYERSVSLPAEDITDVSEKSVKAKKRFFESQIKKEMVVDQLMMQNEEESSPEHKSFHHKPSDLTTSDPETMVSRQIHSHIFSHELEEQIESLVPENKHISEHKDESSTVVPTTVKAVCDKPDKVDARKCVKRTDSVTYEAEVVQVKEDPTLHMDSSILNESVKHVKNVFEVPSQKLSDTVQKYEQFESIGHINYLDSQHKISEEVAEVIKYRSDSISKPSDSLEVHIDKSEIEETEKDMEIDEDIKRIEAGFEDFAKTTYRETEEEVIPDITITYSGKQRPDSYSQGESEDTQSESDITPEDLRDKETPSKFHEWDQETTVLSTDVIAGNVPDKAISTTPHVHTPEEHIPDTVWEVPIQQEPETIEQETVEDIPIEKQPILEKDEEESQRSLTESCEMKSDFPQAQVDIETDHHGSIEGELSLTESALEFKGLHSSVTKQRISEEEAREIAKEIVNHIEDEISKRSEIIVEMCEDTNLPIASVLSNTEVSDYIKKLTGKEDVEVKLIESVLAKKQREQILKLSRADTTSSMEITDEDLRSSGVETDNSPLESQGSRLCPVEDKSEDDTTEDFLKHEKDLDDDLDKLKEKDVLEKTLAEVKESLEAAQDELIEEQKKKKEVLKKQSPSEFEFKVLTLEKYADEFIHESVVEEASVSVDFKEKSDQPTKSGVLETKLTEKGDVKREKHSSSLEEIGHIKSGDVEKLSDKKEIDSFQVDSTQKETEVSESIRMVTGKNEIKSVQKGSTSYSDDEEKVEHSRMQENITLTSDGLIADTFIKNQENTKGKTEESFDFNETKEIDSDGKHVSIEEQKKEHRKTGTFEEFSETKKSTTVLKDSGQTVTESIIQNTIVSKTSVIQSQESHTHSKTETSTTILDTAESLLSEGVILEDLVEKIEEGLSKTDIVEKEEIRRTLSDESQKSSQDESIKSPSGVDHISSSSSSGRKGDSDTMHTIDRPEVALRKHKTGSSTHKRAEVRSGADYEPYSSSGESYYHSFEQTSESIRTPSRPCSSDVDALIAGVGTTGSSEYESAVSHDVSAKSFTSYEYHTAVSSLSSRESMKSLDSESSGNLASVEISSEASETLIPSAMELESDMEGFPVAVIEEERAKLKTVLEPYEREIPHHVIKGESPPHIPTLSEVRDYDRSISLDISSECGVSEDEAEASSSASKDIDIVDASSKMKRSHEMTFQPEPRPIVYDNVVPDAISQEEKFVSSLDDSASILSSSMSETAAIQTVIERSRTESERMDGSATSDQLSLTVSGTSEQLSFSSESREDISIQQSIKHETVSTQSVNSDNQVDSVLLMTSSVNTDGVQSVCTQVTSQTKPSQSKFDENTEDSHVCSNGPTQVEYNADYDDVKETKKRPGHRRNESTSFKVSAIPILKKDVEAVSSMKSSVVQKTEDVAESDKYTDSKILTSKEYQNDEKKDIDEAEKIEEESYQTEADQGFHRDMREGRNIIHDMSSLEEEHEELIGLEGSRPQSQISKSDSEGGHRHMSSGFSDDRPDSELAELLKQCSSDAGSEDPIERPKTPEPSEDCEIKDDTPEFSSEAQASVTELEMEYSGAFSRTQEYESHVSPIREKVGLNWEHPISDHEEELAEAEAAFQMVPHSIPHILGGVHPDTILEDPVAEKHELETRDMALKEEMRKRKAQIESTSPGAIPDITVTQHMTPLKDRGFHYPDLELEEALTNVQIPPTSVSVITEVSETETDQESKHILDDDILEDLNVEDADVGDTSVTTEERTVFESKHEIPERDSASDSPTSDSFEMLEKPDIADDFVIIEEVGKEAQEQDQEGKSVAIGKKRIVKKRDDTEDEVVLSPPAPVTRMTDIKYYPDGSAPFPFDSDSPPTNVESTQSGDGTSQEGSPPSDVEQYESDVEAGKKWIEMQFQGDQATAVYGYEIDYERGPLEDIKEEDATDLENNSSRFGSLGSQVSQSAGSFGSMKESYGSTPDYDVLAGRKYFTRSGEHDDVSMSSLQEFERLENLIAMDLHKNRSSGSQDSLNSSGKSNRHTGSGKSAGDDISLASLKEFEGLEHACVEAAKIELKAKEEEALLSEIEEGHESQASESESCETISAGVARGDSDEEDYEKRMFEIDEIIRQAQTNVEKFIDLKEKDSATEGNLNDKTESMGRGDSIEEVAKIPDLDLDQPLYSLATTSVSSYGKKSSIQQWKDLDDEIQTSTDSLEIKQGSSANVLRDNLTTSTDSLEVKPSGDKDLMSASTDSIELQAKQKNVKAKDIMTDSIEVIGDKTSMITSTDSLETDPPKLFSDSIDEEDGGHFAGHLDQSSSSGKGDLSSSGKEDSCEQLRMPPPRAELLLGSTDSLEPTSSTATHATYHYETDSIMSSSFTSQGSNTLMSSTETLDTGAKASAWFDSDKPYVTEIIEPVIGEDGYTHTIHRTIEMPPEIHNVTFRGPDADQALRDYIERFGPGEDVCESQETDEAGNIHTTRVIQKRVVIRPDEFGGPTTRLTESELNEYLQRFSDDQEESFTESQSSSQITRNTITRQVISSTPKQELTSSQVKGESAGEKASPSPVPPTTREGEEVLMDLAAGLQDAKGGSISGPSSGK